MEATDRIITPKKNKIKQSLGDRIIQGFIILVILALCLVIILPCINVLALSLNDGADAAKGGVYFFPRAFTLENFKQVFSDGSIMKAYKYTILRVVIGTLLTLIVTSLAAFALKEKDLPGVKVITILITFTMLFGGGMIPTYVQYKNLVSVTYLLMMRAYFEGIPASLEESAKLDGCGYFGIYGRIILPLSKPVIAVIGLYTAVNHWNDWFSGAFYMTSNEKWPVQTVLQQMLARAMSASQKDITSVAQALVQGASTVTSDSLKMAAVVITTVPILLIYPFVQKYFASGIMIGAVKG